ncbi:uncharacterized protein LOC142950837 isoform X3 [Anarhichas minor]|uniref:uncharacterized protein LOC142950837 isoform X3 n=1 Tax=Anarhichas minor TaxID=65739 RepID=UPI003F732D3B
MTERTNPSLVETEPRRTTKDKQVDFLDEILNTLDMSLQECHCGWSKVTTYKGLRIHQGSMGCTARGQKGEQYGQPYVGGHADYQKDFNLDVYTPIKNNYSSDVSLQEQPYVGGLADYQKDFHQDVYTPIKNADYYSDVSHQECHCGWSKVTTYQVLRTHQWKMGCTPNGKRTQEEEQWVWKNRLEEVDQLKHQPATTVTFKKQREPLSPRPSSPTTAAEIMTKIKLEKNPLPSPPRHSSQSNTITKLIRQLQDSCAGVQREPLSPRPSSPTTDAEITRKIKLENKPLPAPRSQTGTIPKLSRQLQDSCAGVQGHRLVRERPTVPPRPEVVRPRENDRRAQTLSEVRQDRNRVDMKQEIQMREQKVAQARSSVKAREGKLEAEWLEINSMFSEVVRVAEDAKRKSLNRSFSKLRTTTSTMMKEIQQKLEKLAVIELEWISNFAVAVELDPTTQYECFVSADGKRLSTRGGTQGAQWRFGSVLGLNRMTSGKSYWEVVVSNKTGWSLGVATGDAQCKGKLLICPDNGYWVAEHSKNKFAALTNPPVGLPLKEKPQKVGVFVDYEEGLVSFYDVTAQSHIYSFTECAFTEGIYPFFIVHVIEDGSADPLIISTVKRQ